MKLRLAAVVILCVVCIGASRPMLRGYPIGTVTAVNKPDGIISVDLGSNDHVLKGFQFSVVDGEGEQVSIITVDELYNDMFWSGRLSPETFRKIRPGFQVRWLFTPEIKAVADALKRNDAKSYKNLFDRFPDSAFLPRVISMMPEEMLKGLNRDYYEALKSYRKEDFEAIIKKYSGTAYAAAARKELKSIEQFDTERQKAAEEREKRAAEYEAEQKRRQAIDESAGSRKANVAGREALGKLVNNSNSSVRFVFGEPSSLAPVSVMPNSTMDARQRTGSYTYKVFKVEDQFNTNPDQQPELLKEGSVDIQFDFWEVVYP